jgi:serine/threonine protein kinase
MAILVFHEESEQHLVLKRLRAYGDEVKAALISEADLMRVLHDAAPRYFMRLVDCRTDDPSGPWLLMEYAEGGSLRERLDEAPRGTLPFAEAYRYVCQTARGLDAAHDLGIVHRDVKPGNVLVRRDGSAASSDLGISRRLLESDDIPSPYTPKYASPELVKAVRAWQAGLEPPDELVGFDLKKGHDRYAASTVAYETLAGRTPFSEDSEERIGRQPPDPREFNQALGAETAAVLVRGVAENFADRPKRQWDFAVELGHAMVADGLLSNNQMLDARASAPVCSRERIAHARRSPTVRRYSDDPTVTGSPHLADAAHTQPLAAARGEGLSAVILKHPRWIFIGVLTLALVFLGLLPAQTERRDLLIGKVILTPHKHGPEAQPKAKPAKMHRRKKTATATRERHRATVGQEFTGGRRTGGEEQPPSNPPTATSAGELPHRAPGPAGGTKAECGCESKFGESTGSEAGASGTGAEANTESEGAEASTEPEAP